MAASLDVPYQVEAKIGDVAAVVRKFAKQWRADVVVVGRGRRTDRLRIGANVGDIIARSACPVITVPGAARVIRPHGRQVGRLATLATAPRHGAFVDGVPLAVAV